QAPRRNDDAQGVPPALVPLIMRQTAGRHRSEEDERSCVYTYLTMTRGQQVGTNFLLDPERDFRLGRDVDCDIVLTDPLCSRVHAVVSRDEEGWWLHDQKSRNGSFLNGQKIDYGRLVDGVAVRVGSTEFLFRSTSDRPSGSFASDMNLTQTIVRDSPVNPKDTGHMDLASLQATGAENLVVLHQLALSLLECGDPDEVVRRSLDVLYQRTKAAVVGFLWVTEAGALKPKLVIPEDQANKATLSESLTEKVCRHRHAVWVANSTPDESSSNTQSLRHFADAVCVPLIRDEEALGALHVYKEEEEFTQSQFDLAVRVANVLVIALVRARQQAMLTIEHQRLVDKSASFDELIGDSPPMLRLKSMITRVAKATGCVLVRGESGTGKELVAKALHKNSNRADRPMLSVNCAAIPRDLMESQLFGHKKGAFTGADSDHAGWFKQADSGTLFLDEVGELTLEGQAKLLRILEGHPFLPVGSTKEVSVDVRVIAATNRDLQEFVRERRFREDLFYRLSVFELVIPPLRDRGSDIELLVRHFLDHFKHHHGRPRLGVSQGAMEKLIAYNWPGNVRQLRNVIDSAVVMAEGNAIVPEDLGLRDTGGSDELESLRIDYWERRLIQQALDRTGGNVPEAAKLLGIGRATLYRKVEDYAIKR
ncbi:MAG: sigma 54-interacting transcriptional regulator, partial [Planctomycetales bacterium]|nr:sigma 54-interacting transcriptional regulator [Planctomycetales bacterium]